MVWNPKKGNRITNHQDQECVEIPTQDVDEKYVYRFDILPEWANTIRLIREKVALRRDSPFSDEVDIKSDVLDITCRNEGGEDIVLHFKLQDVYLLGFTVGDFIYEFDPDGAVRIFPASRFLGYGPGYGDMGAGNMTSISIGYASFTQALREIIRGTDTRSVNEGAWKHCIKEHIPRVLVMLPECVRFKWHYLAVSRMMTELNQWNPYTVNDWMELGIKNWRRASKVAFKKERTDRKNPPPSGKKRDVREYVLDDVKKALEDWVWATDLLCVHYYRLEREPRHVLKKVCIKNGKRSVTHLLVLWNNMEVEWRTESDMNHCFPSFVTKKVIIPEPPQPQPPA